MGEQLVLPGPPEDVAETPAVAVEPREYTYEDFQETDLPYQEAYSYRKDEYLHQKAIERISRQAAKAKYTGFKKTYEAYRSHREHTGAIHINGATDFQGQPMELDTGEWRATEAGITSFGASGEVVACVHPLMPMERLVNIDSGVEKLKLAYRKGGVISRWREIIVEKSILASPQKILALADHGIAVNSETAKALISYLHDMENLNYDAIPEKRAITRLGYIEGEGFSPYVPDLVFDGDAKFRHVFGAVRSKGSKNAWMEMAKRTREGTVTARILLAASFASALVAPLGTLPFFVHLWSSESGTGKTVALMLAASVWGDPEPGQYVQTFNSTDVGFEIMASFLNHLPLVIDELQLSRDRRGNTRFNVYKLAEGVGKTRSNRGLGINKTPTWANCVLTSGESPIVSDGAGAGAVNRVIEVECRSGEQVVDNGHEVAETVKRNYGYAGRMFVEILYDAERPKLGYARQVYAECVEALSTRDTTEKQAMAAAVILAADKLITEWIFEDDRALTVDELSQFLATRASVSAGDRGYQYMKDWVTANYNKFNADNNGELAGVIEDQGDGSQIVYIINTVFHRAAEDGGYSSKALLSHLRSRNLILTRGRHNTKGKRIKGINTECVAMKIGVDGDGMVEMTDDDCPEQMDF